MSPRMDRLLSRTRNHIRLSQPHHSATIPVLLSGARPSAYPPTLFQPPHFPSVHDPADRFSQIPLPPEQHHQHPPSALPSELLQAQSSKLEQELLENVTEFKPREPLPGEVVLDFQRSGGYWAFEQV